jgi:hypothetical protein
MFSCACWPNLRSYNTKKLSFRFQWCGFLGYSNQHKGYKCLESSTGRVYISPDVIFDETTFPFSSLHTIAGAQIQAEILPLHPTLCNSLEGDGIDVPNVVNVVDGIAESYAGAIATVKDQNSIASSGNQLEISLNQLATDPFAALDPRTDSGLDSITTLLDPISLDHARIRYALGSGLD